MKHLVTVLDWYGPYNYEEALAAAKSDFADGMYLCTGKVKSAQGKPKIQYVCIAGKELKTRVGDTTTSSSLLREKGSSGLERFAPSDHLERKLRKQMQALISLSGP